MYKDFDYFNYKIIPSKKEVINKITGKTLYVQKRNNLLWISLSINGKNKCFSFTRLVYCYHNNKNYSDNTFVILPKDGNYENITIENLFLIKRCDVKFEHSKKCTQSFHKYITDETAINIFKERKLNFISTIAEKYNVCLNTVSKIFNRKGKYKDIIESLLSQNEINIILSRKSIISEVYINNTFGKWFVLRHSDNSCDKNTIFMCRCICGKLSKLSSSILNQAKAHNSGCKNCANKNKEQPIYRYYFSQMKKRAEARKLEFTITFDDIIEKMHQQNFKCIYTGEDLCFVLGRKNKANSTASLDRIDSSKGYTKENIQWVHKDINRMKWAFSEDRFLYLCTKVTQNKIL